MKLIHIVHSCSEDISIRSRETHEGNTSEILCFRLTLGRSPRNYDNDHQIEYQLHIELSTSIVKHSFPHLRVRFAH